MDFTTRIKIEENKLVHGKRRTVYDCADRVNRSHNYLCRISSLSEEVPFPIEIAVPLMKYQRSYGLLKLIARELGFAVIRLPRVKLVKGDENKISAGYQRVTSKAAHLFNEFLADPQGADFNKLMAALENVVEESLQVRRYAEKKQSKQEELF